MKLLILGASGPLGQQLVKKSLEQKHEITALVRDPSKMPQGSEIHLVKGNILDREILVNALKGKDAVLSTLGVGNSLKSFDLISNFVTILIPAMKETGVKRLIFVSAFGVGETYNQANLIQRLFFRLLLKNIYADKAKGDDQIRRSDLDWTIIYPAKLSNGPYTGKYKAGEQLAMKGMPSISRANVADFMVLQLTENTYLRKSPIISR